MVKKNGNERVYECMPSFLRPTSTVATVTVPALPGLVTEAKILEHVPDTSKDAIRCYFEASKKAKKPIPVEKVTAPLRVSVVA